jgi:hypothetical protein
MRTAHHMKDLGQIGDQRRYVLKLSKDPNEDKRVYFTDVQMQVGAHGLGCDILQIDQHAHVVAHPVHPCCGTQHPDTEMTESFPK